MPKLLYCIFVYIHNVCVQYLYEMRTCYTWSSVTEILPHIWGSVIASVLCRWNHCLSVELGKDESIFPTAAMYCTTWLISQVFLSLTFLLSDSSLCMCSLAWIHPNWQQVRQKVQSSFLKTMACYPDSCVPASCSSEVKQCVVEHDLDSVITAT